MNETKAQSFRANFTIDKNGNVTVDELYTFKRGTAAKPARANKRDFVRAIKKSVNKSSFATNVK